MTVLTASAPCLGPLWLPAGFAVDRDRGRLGAGPLVDQAGPVWWRGGRRAGSRVRVGGIGLTRRDGATPSGDLRAGLRGIHPWYRRGDLGADVVPLGTTYLLSDPAFRPAAANGSTSPLARYTLHLRLLSLRERGGIFNFGQPLEKSADFDDYLVIDVGVWLGRLAAWAQWSSQIGTTITEYQPSGPPRDDEE